MRVRGWELVLPITVAWVAACADARASWITYPVADSLPHAEAPRLRSFDRGHVPEGSDVASLVRGLGELSNVRADFGSLSGPPSKILGEVTDAAATSGAGFLLVDRLASDFVALDSLGEFKGRFGGPGHGPGEFVSPSALALRGDSQVVVVDLSTRIQTFQIDETGGASFRGSVRAPFVPQDVCIGENRTFVLGTRDGSDHLIHEVALDGTVIRSFGESYRSGNRIATMLLARGHLACSGDVVALVRPLLGEIHGYRQDGGLKWIHRLDPYLPPVMIGPIDGGRFSQGFDEETTEHHVLLAQTVPSGSDLLLVQMGRLTLEDRKSQTAPRVSDVFVIEMETGRGYHVASGAYPLLLAVLPQHAVLGYSESPWPQVQLFAFRPDDAS